MIILRFHLVSEYAPYLSKDIDAEHFNFHHRVLSGQKELRPRWKRALDAENAAMGMVLGRIFVKEYFPEACQEALYATWSKRSDAPTTTHRPARLDERRNQGQGPAEARSGEQKSRLIPTSGRTTPRSSIGRSSYCENMMSAARWRFRRQRVQIR